MSTRKTAKPSRAKTTGVLQVLHITGGIHGIAPPWIEPTTDITSWQVVVVANEQGLRTRHVVGWATWEGRVSSAIQRWDWNKRTATTSSGRVYQLVGESGFNRDADYVFNHWMAINRFSAVRVNTRAVERLLARTANAKQTEVGSTHQKSRGMT